MNTADHSKLHQNQAIDTDLSDSDNISAQEQENKETYDLLNNSTSQQEDLSIRLQLAEQELDRTKDQMIRALADADNTRKRALREREDATKFAISSFSRDLISVADNLRRALNAIPADLTETNPEIKNLICGIEATERDLLKSFDKNGIQKIEPLDEMFDPHFHEVMFETAIPNKQGGTIIQVIEAGYILNGRILRPARVGIAKSDMAHTHNEPGKTIDQQA